MRMHPPIYCPAGIVPSEAVRSLCNELISFTHFRPIDAAAQKL
jgi:hypothetical protein